jgi:3-oxoacyl-[acyl-carrier protein] reductase
MQAVISKQKGGSMGKKVALITGASHGIGEACAVKFASNGYNLIINGKNDGMALLKIKEKVIKLGAECIAELVDVCDYEAMKTFIKQACEKTGSPDVLVNNAGSAYIGLFTDMKPQDYVQIINSDLISCMNLCHIVTPYMVHKKSGHIINISSMWGQAGASCEAAYSAAKGGVDAFTKALGKELAPSGISVNAVAPGVVDTRMNRGMLSVKELESLKESIPADRLCNAYEVADTVLLLANAPVYLTSQVIRIDGGMV